MLTNQQSFPIWELLKKQRIWSNGVHINRQKDSRNKIYLILSLHNKNGLFCQFRNNVEK